MYSIFSGKNERIFDWFEFKFLIYLFLLYCNSGSLDKANTEASFIYLKKNNLIGSNYFYEAQTNEIRLNIS